MKNEQTHFGLNLYFGNLFFLGGFFVSESLEISRSRFIGLSFVKTGRKKRGPEIWISLFSSVFILILFTRQSFYLQL